MLEHLKQEVCRANLELVASGLVLQTWGNASGVDRRRGLVVIKPSGVPYETMRPAQMVVVSLETGKVVAGALRPSSDTPTHLELYRAFPGVGGIVHTHSLYATAWAQARRALPAYGTTHADFCHGEVPCTRMLSPSEIKAGYEAATGRVIVEKFRRLDPLDQPAVLVAGHGPFTWGADVHEAVHNAQVLEFIARLAIETLHINPQVRTLPHEMLDKHFLRKHGAGASYGQARWSAQRLCRAGLSLIALLVLSIIAAGCAGMPSRDESFEPHTISFDSDEIGKLPPDFSTALTGGGGPVSWVVREDATSPNSKRVLAQESSDDTSYRFPMCVYDKTVARDVAGEVNYKAIAGKVDQAGGIVLRYAPENYYIARANALEDNVDLFKTVRGKRSKIEEVAVKVTAGEWHTLRFEAKGCHLKVIFDGKVVIETDDRTFANAGKVGLWTKADSVSAFSSLKIERAR